MTVLGDRLRAAWDWATAEGLRKEMGALGRLGHQYAIVPPSVAGLPAYRSPAFRPLPGAALTLTVNNAAAIDFPASALPAVEKWLDEAEATRSAAVVHRSPSLTEFVDGWVKAGRRRQAMELADKVLETNDERVVVEALRAAAELSGSFPSVWVVWVNGAILLYRAGTEDEVRSRFDGLRPKKSVPAGEKTVARMILHRLRKVFQAVAVNNANASRGHSSYGRHVAMPVLDSKAAWTDFLKSDKHSGVRSYVRGREEIAGFLGREDVTDGMVKEAWDLLQVEEVVKS